MAGHDFECGDVVVIIEGNGKGSIAVVDDEAGAELVVYPHGDDRIGKKPFLTKSPSSLRHATSEELEAFRRRQRVLEAAWGTGKVFEG